MYLRPVRRRWIGREGDLLTRTIRMHDEPELTLLLRRKRPVRNDVRGEVRVRSPSISIDGGDHVVELMSAGQRAYHAATAAEQHRIRGDSHALQQGDEERRLVLAVTVVV